MKNHAVENTMQDCWKKNKLKKFLKTDQLTKNKEKKHDEAKYQLNDLNMSMNFSCKKLKITSFDNDIIINHSHMLDCSWWNWNLQSKHDMFLTIDSNLEKEFHSSQTQVTHSSRSEQKECKKRNEWVSWTDKVWWHNFYFFNFQNSCIWWIQSHYFLWWREWEWEQKWQ